MNNTLNKIFVIVGSNFFWRQRIIENIKNKIKISTPSNTFVFYSKELEIVKLKERIFTPSLDKDKLLIFKESLALSVEIKNFFIKNFEEIIIHNYIIFEIDKDYDFFKDKNCDNFLNFIFRKAVMFKSSQYTGDISFQTFKKAIRRFDLSYSLYTLEKLFNNKTDSQKLGSQILGILVEEFSYVKDYSKKDKLFDYLWELDREIKEGLLQPKLAIEIALIKAMGVN